MPPSFYYAQQALSPSRISLEFRPEHTVLLVDRDTADRTAIPEVPLLYLFAYPGKGFAIPYVTHRFLEKRFCLLIFYSSYRTGAGATVWVHLYFEERLEADRFLEVSPNTRRHKMIDLVEELPGVDLEEFLEIGLHSHSLGNPNQRRDP